jgi:nitroreductase
VDIFEVMETCRAIRYLRPDPVSDELIEKLIWAATRAPSPGNSQGYGFIVVRDKAKLDAIGDAVYAVMAKAISTVPSGNVANDRIAAGSLALAASIRNLPALIVVAGKPVYPPSNPDERHVWSALYPATQNLLLAARALGLGATLTTYHHLAGPMIREVLAIPDEVRIGAVVPIGWPDRPFGPVSRRPVEDFIHREAW